MPTILRAQGYRFIFFSNDHAPPHVHVRCGSGWAKYWLKPVDVADAGDFAPMDLKRAKLLVIEHRETFLGRWHEFFNT